MGEAVDSLNARLDRLTAEIHALAGVSFNVGSHTQLGQVLFQHLRIPGGIKRYDGSYHVDTDTLMTLEHPIIPKLVEYRRLRTTRRSMLRRQWIEQKKNNGGGGS